MFTLIDAYTDKVLRHINAPDSERSLYASGEAYVTDYTETIVDSLSLGQIKEMSVALINGLTGDRIYSFYSREKQANMQASYTELLATGEHEGNEGLQIKSAWNWIKSVRALSNIANNTINNAETILQINQVINDYKAALLTVTPVS